MIDALLAHIGLDHHPGPDPAGLRAVHRAFVSRVAYDGLTAQLGEHAPLDPDRLVERLLATGRGGYCFEINTILLTLLDALDFTVQRREAIVGAREERAGGAPTNHQGLVVRTAGGETYICDAGWGEGFLDPLPLRTGSHRQDALTWGVERDGDGWWVQQHAWGSSPGFRFGDTAVPMSAFAVHHERLAASPDSSFVQTLVVQKPTGDRIVTLRARTLSEKGPAVDEKVVLADEDAFAQTLRDVFGIDPGALGAERVARLWANALDQHEAYVRTASSPASAPPGPPPPASA